MTIEEIYNFEDISIRSFNVCNGNDLTDLTTILKYFNENRTFINLKNCGEKSNGELTALCLKYIDDISNHIVESLNTKRRLTAVINNLTRSQRGTVNFFIELKLNDLSNRSKNSISSLLNGDFKVQNISEKILTDEKFNFQDIKNIGANTAPELKRFFYSIIEFIEKVAEIPHENDLISLRNRFFIERTFSTYPISTEILEPLSIFSLLHFLIKNHVIYEKRKSIVFQKAFKIYDKQIELTLDDIAVEIKATKERVRQIRKGIFKNLFNTFKFIKNIEFDLYQKYGIDQHQDLIIVNSDLNNMINRINNTAFSKEFNTFIIYIFLSDKFKLIGEIDDVLQTKYLNERGQHTWANFYLVNKETSYLFNFNNFANDLNRRLNDRIEDSYSLNFNSYLLSFSISKSLDVLNKIPVIAEEILNNEFGLFIETDDNFTFNKNTSKNAYQYAYEALKILGKPSKVNEITLQIVKLHPEYDTNDARVRASMTRNNGFVPIGRRSIFGLKEWENEIENFKGGTIRVIVFEYLEKQVIPKHISEIAKYVMLYRPNTYERSILDNLKADKTRTFIFFKNSIIGLQSKKYDSSFVQLTPTTSPVPKSWEERYEDLTQFVSRYKRLPFSSGCPDEEIGLYRWYNIQIRKIKRGHLVTEQRDLLSQITVLSDSNDTNRKRRNNNTQNYHDLKQFVFLNNRLPSANKTGEKHLYDFFYKQRKLFKQGNLDEFKQQQLIEIAKIIQN